MEVSNNAPNHKIITWVMGNVCNYSCSYCSDDLNGGKHKFPKLETAIDIFKKFRGESPIYFEITGGEPTLWPQLGDYVDEISDENTYIEVASNGSRSPQFWKNFNSKVDFFYLSFHAESANEENFTKTLEALNERYLIQVTLLIQPKYWTRIKKYYDYLKNERTDLKINITPSPIRPKFGEKFIDGMTPEIKSIWNDKPTKRAGVMPLAVPKDLHINDKPVNWKNFQLGGYNIFEGMMCYAPKNRLYIGPSGNVFHASCLVNGPLGNVYDKSYSLPNIEYVVCQKQKCGCKVDAIVPKSGEYHQNIDPSVFTSY